VVSRTAVSRPALPGCRDCRKIGRAFPTSRFALDRRSRPDGATQGEEAGVNQGNKRFGIGMALGIAVGMIVYRLIFG
jgi:hypothetical protein